MEIIKNIREMSKKVNVNAGLVAMLGLLAVGSFVHEHKYLNEKNATNVEENNENLVDIKKTSVNGDFIQVVHDANDKVYYTTDVLNVSYREKDRIKTLTVHRTGGIEQEKHYRSITTPEISIWIETNEKGEKTYTMYNLSGLSIETKELEIARHITSYTDLEINYEDVLKYETASYFYNNSQYITQDHKEVDKLVYKLDGEEMVRLMKYEGELDNKVYYTNITIDIPSVLVIGSLDAQGNIADYQFMTYLDDWYSTEFVSMTPMEGIEQLSIREAEELESEYNEIEKPWVR